MKKKGFLSVAAGVILFVFLFVFTEEFSKGMSTGLANCAKIIIPSIFPFMVAAALTGSGDLPPKLKRITGKITETLFSLPAESFFAIIIGQLGGCLAGAKAIESLVKSGSISESKAKRMLLFCINTGIGFSVNAVGSVMLNSRKSGRILLVSLTVSSLLLGIISRFIPDKSESNKKLPSRHLPFSASVVESVSSSAIATVNACAFVTAFSGINAVTESVIHNENTRILVSCLLEITNGCFLAAGKISLPLIAAVCAFGGLCVHMQIFAVAKNIPISIPQFYIFRILHAASAYAVCAVILRFFPAEQEVFLLITENAAVWSFSAPASVSLLFLSALLILDLDNKDKIW